MRQYRSELRKPHNEAADISWEIGAGYVRTAKATVQDVSGLGMGLLVSMPLSVGATVQITTGAKTRKATVKRCVRQGSQHLLGIRFER